MRESSTAHNVHQGEGNIVYESTDKATRIALVVFASTVMIILSFMFGLLQWQLDNLEDRIEAQIRHEYKRIEVRNE